VHEASSRNVSAKIGDGAGLSLVVRPNGEASWVLRYSSKGCRRDVTLGRWPTVSLGLARELADDARKTLAKGVDPAAERRAERAKSERGSDTVLKLFEAWLSKSSHGAVYRGNIEAAFQKDVLPSLGKMPPHLVTRDHVLAILRVIESRGAVVMVRRVRMWLRQMFEFGVEHEARPLLPNCRRSPLAPAAQRVEQVDGGGAHGVPDAIDSPLHFALVDLRADVQ
jgi:hypothetical protein